MGPSVSDERVEFMREDPFCAQVGIELAEVGAGSAEARLPVREAHHNFHGMTHGGAIYSLADAAFAAAANAEGEDAYALETNISYLDSPAAGTTVVARASRTHETRRTAEYEVVVTNDDGRNRIATFRGRAYKP